MYQRQAFVVARHVDDLAFVERSLRQSGWSVQLDDALTPQPSLPDGQLKDLTSPPWKTASDLWPQ